MHYDAQHAKQTKLQKTTSSDTVKWFFIALLPISGILGFNTCSTWDGGQSATLLWHVLTFSFLWVTTLSFDHVWPFVCLVLYANTTNIKELILNLQIQQQKRPWWAAKSSSRRHWWWVSPACGIHSAPESQLAAQLNLNTQYWQGT